MESKNNNQESLRLINESLELAGKKDEFLESAKKAIRALKETVDREERQGQASYQELLDSLESFSTAVDGTKSSHENNKNTDNWGEEEVKILQEIKEMQGEINLLWKALKEKIKEVEIEISHPTPEKIKERITIREANETEQNRLQERVPGYKKEAVKICARIFNKCDYPWYLTGSIAFLINAKESKKQPDDIDIIFHEKDFDAMSQEFKKLGFGTGIAQNTGCPFIRGKIEVKDENGEMKQVEVEAFGQQTEKPNGLINPGAKDTKYQVISNKLSNNEQENFNILDKGGQVELYFKNLSSEIKDFNFDSFMEKELLEAEDKSKKFINRLANLFELNDNSQIEVVRMTRKLCESDEDNLLLRNFIDISKKFNEEKRSGQGLNNIFNEGHLQIAIENLKKEITREQEALKTSYLDIVKKIKDIDEMSLDEKKDLSDKIDEEINSKREMIDKFLKSNQEINNEEEKAHDLPIYIFISKFKENFINSFCEKMVEIKKELV